jgi:threonine dehydratase
MIDAARAEHDDATNQNAARTCRSSIKGDGWAAAQGGAAAAASCRASCATQHHTNCATRPCCTIHSSLVLVRKRHSPLFLFLVGIQPAYITVAESDIIIVYYCYKYSNQMAYSQEQIATLATKAIKKAVVSMSSQDPPALGSTTAATSTSSANNKAPAILLTQEERVTERFGKSPPGKHKRNYYFKICHNDNILDNDSKRKSPNDKDYWLTCDACCLAYEKYQHQKNVNGGYNGDDDTAIISTGNNVKKQDDAQQDPNNSEDSDYNNEENNTNTAKAQSNGNGNNNEDTTGPKPNNTSRRNSTDRLTAKLYGYDGTKVDKPCVMQSNSKILDRHLLNCRYFNSDFLFVWKSTAQRKIDGDLNYPPDHYPNRKNKRSLAAVSAIDGDKEDEDCGGEEDDELGMPSPTRTKRGRKPKVTKSLSRMAKKRTAASLIATLPRDIELAARRISPHIYQTPLFYSDYLSELNDGAVYLKLESEQVTGSFKARGALNKIMSLSADELNRGVMTSSTGNHGQGFARALSIVTAMTTNGTTASNNNPKSRGIIYLPQGANDSKIEALKMYKGAVRLKYHASTDCVETEIFAKQQAYEYNMTWVAPYNDPVVIAGQGTVGREIWNAQPNVDVVLVTVGGGGLISGIAAWFRAVNPHVQVIGCQPEASPEMFRSVQKGEIVTMNDKERQQPTLSDGSAGGIEPGAITFDLCRELVHDFILVSEDEIADAIRFVAHKHHKIIEGAAGVAVAAYRKQANQPKFDGKTVAVVVCGSNISADKLKDIL